MADSRDLSHHVSRLSPGEWQLDADPEPAFPSPTESEGELLPPPARGDGSESPPLANSTGVDDPSRKGAGQKLFPSTESRDQPELPPSPLQIVEAMLFVGGPPLTAAKACSAVRGLTPERFRDLADELARKYRRQNRPYAVVSRDDGFVLAVKPAFRSVREKLYGGPREARLTQPALDVLSLIAYRQPLSKPEVDALRGSDSASVIRQLVRFGLIAAAHRAAADQKTVRYGTTPRFLELFNLTSLDDLPRLTEGA